MTKHPFRTHFIALLGHAEYNIPTLLNPVLCDLNRGGVKNDSRYNLSLDHWFNFNYLNLISLGLGISPRPYTVSFTIRLT